LLTASRRSSTGDRPNSADSRVIVARASLRCPQVARFFSCVPFRVCVVNHDPKAAISPVNRMKSPAASQ